MRTTVHIPTLLARAVNLFESGKAAEAAQAAELLLKLDRRNAAANHLRGLAAMQMGDAPKARRHLLESIKQEPGTALFHLNFAKFCLAQAKHSDCIRHSNVACALDPKSIDSVMLRFEAEKAMENHSAALQTGTQLLQHQPDNPLLLHQVGLLALQQGDHDKAIQYFNIARNISENADLVNSLGLAQRAAGELDSAITSFRWAFSQTSALHIGLNLADTLARQGETDASLEIVSRLQINHPQTIDVPLKAAGIFVDVGETQLAEHFAQQAYAINPCNSDLLACLGLIHYEKNDYSKAADYYQRALQQDANAVNTKWNFGNTLFNLGKIKEGWEHYAYRWQKSGTPITYRATTGTEWCGQTLSNKSILAWGEQGIGDEILFASMIPDLCAQAKQTILTCDERLVSLFSRSFPEATVVAHREMVNQRFAYQTPTGNLGRYFRDSLEKFPGTPYLIPDAQRVNDWKNWLDYQFPDADLVVGIAWRSQLRSKRLQSHFATLQQMSRLFDLDRVGFVVLQYDDYSADMNELPIELRKHLIHPQGLDLKNQIDETAALMKALDMVVSPFTSTAELAGAVGCHTLIFGHGAGGVGTFGGNQVPWFANAHYFGSSTNEDLDASLTIIEARIEDQLRHAQQASKF